MQFKAKGDSNSKDFIQLKDGESVAGVFAGEPKDFKEHFQLGRCTGDGCPNCKAGSKPGFKFEINFLVKENDQYVAKIFKQGWKVYKALASLAEDYDLAKYAVKIKRKGSTKDDTTYDIIPLPDGKLSDEKVALLKAVVLHDFDKKKPEAVASHDKIEAGLPKFTDDVDDDSDLPF